MYTELTKEEKKEQLLKDAKREMGRLKAMKELIKGDDDCEAILIIDGVKHAFSNSKIFMRCVIFEMHEIQKAINEQPNKW